MRNWLLILTLILAIGATGCGSKMKKSHKGSDSTDFYDGDDKESVKGEKVDKKSPAPEVSDGSLKDFGRALQTNDEERILAEASKILSVNPNQEKVLNGLGVFYLKNKKSEMAKYFFGKVLKVNGSNSPALNNLGVIAIEEKEERKAMEYFKKAIDAENDNVAALGNLGTIYLKYEDYEKALEALKRAHSYDKGNITIANNYAIALAGNNQLDRAVDVYEDLAKSRNVSVQLNEAILWTEFKQDFVKAKELLNKIRLLTTDPGILKKVNDLSKWMESKQKKNVQG